MGGLPNHIQLPAGSALVERRANIPKSGIAYIRNADALRSRRARIPMMIRTTKKGQTQIGAPVKICVISFVLLIK